MVTVLLMVLCSTVACRLQICIIVLSDITCILSVTFTVKVCAEKGPFAVQYNFVFMKLNFTN